MENPLHHVFYQEANYHPARPVAAQEFLKNWSITEIQSEAVQICIGAHRPHSKLITPDSNIGPDKGSRTKHHEQTPIWVPAPKNVQDLG